MGIKSDNMEQGYVILQLGEVNCLAYCEDGMILKVVDGIESRESHTPCFLASKLYLNALT